MGCGGHVSQTAACKKHQIGQLSLEYAYQHLAVLLQLHQLLILAVRLLSGKQSAYQEGYQH